MTRETQTSRASNKTAIIPSPEGDQRREVAELWLLRDRLRSENEIELLSKISKCQEPLALKCNICQDTKVVKQWCKRKWCPCCAKRIAAQRSSEMELIVAHFRWPLFATLTMRNSSSLSSGEVRHLRRAFGKLRHRKLWTRSTRGGIAAVEITNTGKGWHPHLHAVIDCAWLAWQTPPPRRGSTREEKRECFTAAAVELEAAWSKCLGQSTSSVRVKRASRHDISKEVTKYTVKNEDLIMAEGHIGEMIRALDSCRLMTTFGSAHGRTVKDVRLIAKAELKKNREDFLSTLPPPCKCGCGEWMPDEEAARRATWTPQCQARQANSLGAAIV